MSLCLESTTDETDVYTRFLQINKKKNVHAFLWVRLCRNRCIQALTASFQQSPLCTGELQSSQSVIIELLHFLKDLYALTVS